ncbi:OVARIAN TUMOR DOMAIN-containing deubiquitinating enzyme 4-like isoform X2 [Musa acuminata AAA Group]
MSGSESTTGNHLPQLRSIRMLFILIRASFPLAQAFLLPLSASHHHFDSFLWRKVSHRIPGDGRCLFRSVVHGACLRAGKPSPSESIQKELADELRSKVADEFIRRRTDTEWFLEGDFDTYVKQIRKPQAWGGEPELLMCSHVLRMPITVYMSTDSSDGLKIIAEYGQEYGKENPIRVLYHGYGHYDALQMPLTKTKSK